MPTSRERSDPRATSSQAQPSGGAQKGDKGPNQAAPAATATVTERQPLTGAQSNDQQNDTSGVSEDPGAGRGVTLATVARAIGAVPEAFRPSTEPEPMVVQTPAQVNRSIEGAREGHGDVVGAGGTGGIEVTLVPRGPARGRVERRRAPRAAGRQHRGAKATESHRRYMATRPRGQHPQLSTWDLLPLAKRFSLAGQERSIFRSRGLLVSRFDFTSYYALLENNARELPKVFPKPPIWWPSDWGNIPIMLPWELSQHRAQLVSASPDSALWKEIYQIFLEQLAGGWDLWYHTIANRENMVALPSALASAMLSAGAFAFCVSPAPSLAMFLTKHPIEGGAPDQRQAKAESWDRINALKAEEEKDRVGVGMGYCSCTRKNERASRRLGLEALLVEAANSDLPEGIEGDGTKLVALSVASLRFAIDADAKIGRAVQTLQPSQSNSYQTPAWYEALDDLKDLRRLAYYLPARFAALMARIS